MTPRGQSYDFHNHGDRTNFNNTASSSTAKAQVDRLLKALRSAPPPVRSVVHSIHADFVSRIHRQDETLEVLREEVEHARSLLGETREETELLTKERTAFECLQAKVKELEEKLAQAIDDRFEFECGEEVEGLGGQGVDEPVENMEFDPESQSSVSASPSSDRHKSTSTESGSNPSSTSASSSSTSQNQTVETLRAELESLRRNYSTASRKRKALEDEVCKVKRLRALAAAGSNTGSSITLSTSAPSSSFTSTANIVESQPESSESSSTTANSRQKQSNDQHMTEYEDDDERILAQFRERVERERACKRLIALCCHVSEEEVEGMLESVAESLEAE
ncbi:hypothetical protein HK102_002479 [Quaeritorhiza haematococci]|nr:hypothetical protein HK102_002479 [Quaeritorhiza haematococci]